MNYLTIEEIHQEESKMLKHIAEFCEKNNITYYICGGTLLGAIRHKGFIPWDDDIDLLFPRPDFEKFEKIAKENNYMINPDLEVIAFDYGNMEQPYCKVMNHKIEIDSSCIKNNLEKYLWVDIFPMDGLPKESSKVSKLYKKVIFYRKLLLTLTSEESYIENFSKAKWKVLPKKIVRKLLKFLPTKVISKKIDKLSKKYAFNDCDYVGGVVWGYGPQEKMLKSEINTVKVDFEDLKVNTFACYEKYLKNLYGDYMKLPPVEKRQTHDIKVYRIES